MIKAMAKTKQEREIGSTRGGVEGISLLGRVVGKSLAEKVVFK